MAFNPLPDPDNMGKLFCDILTPHQNRLDPLRIEAIGANPKLKLNR